MAQVASADVWRQELESTSSRQHVVPVAAHGLWVLVELTRSYGRPAACRTRWQTLYWVRTTESDNNPNLTQPRVRENTPVSVVERAPGRGK